MTATIFFFRVFGISQPLSSKLLNLLSLAFARDSREVKAVSENDHPLCRISILECGGTTNWVKYNVRRKLGEKT